MGRYRDSSGAQFVAGWDLSLVRFFFLDYDGGDDANVGYIDSASSTPTFAAGEGDAVAIKTYEELRNRIPRIGNGRKFVVVTKPRASGATYLKKDGVTEDFLDLGVFGYAYKAWRGSNDFTLAGEDGMSFGAFRDPALAGPNGDGSWTKASSTGSNGDGTVITISGGTLPAEADLFGKAIQTDDNAGDTKGQLLTTVLERVSNTEFRTHGAAINNGTNFWFVTPGVAVSHIEGGGLAGGSPTVPDDNLDGYEIQGLRCTDAFALKGATLSMSFCEFAGNVDFNDCNVDGNPPEDPDGGKIFTAFGSILFQSDFTTRRSTILFRGPCVAGDTEILSCRGGSGEIGRNGGRFKGSLRVSNFGGSGFISNFSTAAGGSQSGFVVGNYQGATGTAVFVDGAVTIEGAVGLGLVRFSSGASLKIQGQGSRVAAMSFQGAITGDGITFVDTADEDGCRDCTLIFLPNAVAWSLTASGNDVLMRGSQAATFASLTNLATPDEFVDDFGNRVMGYKVPVTRKTTGTLSNAPVLTADPSAPVDGDIWIIDDGGGTRELRVRMGGVTYSTALTT